MEITRLEAGMLKCQDRHCSYHLLSHQSSTFLYDNVPSLCPCTCSISSSQTIGSCIRFTMAGFSIPSTLHVQFSTCNIIPLSICNALTLSHLEWNYGDYQRRYIRYMLWPFHHQFEVLMLRCQDRHCSHHLLSHQFSTFLYDNVPLLPPCTCSISSSQKQDLVYFSPWLGFNTLCWRFTPLSIPCSVFHWQHHTTFDLQCSHLVTHDVEFWRLLEEITHMSLHFRYQFEVVMFKCQDRHCSHHLLSLFLHISL